MRFITDNYNHLFEQPVLFYALAVYLYLSQSDDELQVQLAWGYVALRTFHSFIQLTSNNVSARAVVFIASMMVLLLMVVRSGLNLIAA